MVKRAEAKRKAQQEQQQQDALDELNIYNLPEGPLGAGGQDAFIVKSNGQVVFNGQAQGGENGDHDGPGYPGVAMIDVDGVTQFVDP